MLNFTKAIVAAIHVYKNDPGASLRVLEKYTRIGDREILERTRRYYAEKIIQEVPYPTKAGLRAVIEEQAAVNSAIASVKVDSLIDSSFLIELESSGFVRALYNK